MWPLPVDNSLRWTPRRALMLTGLILMGFGAYGFFKEWGAADPMYLDLPKRLAYIVLGGFILYIGEVWSSPWKRYTAMGMAILMGAVGILTLAAGGGSEPNLGFTHLNRFWEAVLYLAAGGWHAVAVWYPRRHYEYEWATGVSTGIRDR